MINWLRSVISWFNGKKTYLVSIGSIIAIWTAYIMGTNTDLSSCITQTVALILAMTIRNGITNS